MYLIGFANLIRTKEQSLQFVNVQCHPEGPDEFLNLPGF